ncbi:MAG: DoxX family protein, partial [Methylococcales bacterium]|nr:DoxX family protein [Methylococcales bacterium]
MALNITTLFSIYQKLIVCLNNSANQIPPLFLRLILAYEFWEAGIMKFDGENWFSHITFPPPFNLLSNDLLWAMSTWIEIIGAIALVIGLGTRFFSL